MELYFHIPFCVKKCLYCDFLSFPTEERTGEACPEDPDAAGRVRIDEGIKAAYMKALTREAAERADEYGQYTVTSVFFGGGTPSTVEAEQLAGLLETVRSRYRLAEDAEITVEVNPGAADREKLKIYRMAGVNRLSMGLQSSVDRELAAIGRIHTWSQFLDTYRAAVEAGFSNINIDVMSALPGQTCESYCGTLERLLALKPQPVHISAYSLILEEGTPFYELEKKGKLALPDEDTERLMYHRTKEILERAGFERYEISNYARPGFACRHNCGYWTRDNYVGFGIGAASLVDNVRFRNGDSLAAYLKAPLGCRQDIQKLSVQEQMEEFMFLGLRLTEGISVSNFQKAFGASLEEIYGRVIEKNVRDGLLEYRSLSGGRRLALTERGLDLANYVMSRFLR